MNLIGLLLFRLGWQLHPTLWSCGIFWSAVWVNLFLPRTSSERAEAKSRTAGRSEQEIAIVALCVLFGMLSNTLVTLANGGIMPVVGSMAVGSPFSVWIPATPQMHLLWLSDHTILLGCSIGDLLMVVPSFLLWSARKVGLLTPLPKRMEIAA
jgi:hypothetical protein